MKITDLEYCNVAEQSTDIQGAAFSSSSSSSFATPGASGSSFRSFAIGRSGSFTLTDLRSFSFSSRGAFYSSASARSFAYARD